MSHVFLVYEAGKEERGNGYIKLDYFSPGGKNFDLMVAIFVMVLCSALPI